MFEYLISQINNLSQVARETYGVNPIIFITIYLLCVPLFYYSIIRTFRAIAKKLANEIMVWSIIFLCANVAPFLYVMIFGKNIPWWVYIIIFIIVGQGILSFIIRIRKTPKINHNILPK
jgi:hypothetical protein